MFIIAKELSYIYLTSNHFWTLLVGVSTADKGSLRYIYERDANFSAIPTYGVLMGQEALTQTNLFTGATPGWENIDLSKVVYKFKQIRLQLCTVTYITLAFAWGTIYWAS